MRFLLRSKFSARKTEWGANAMRLFSNSYFSARKLQKMYTSAIEHKFAASGKTHLV